MTKTSIAEDDDPFVSPLRTATNKFHGAKRTKNLPYSEDEVRVTRAQRLRRNIFGMKSRNRLARGSNETPVRPDPNRQTTNSEETSPCDRVASTNDYQRHVDEIKYITCPEDRARIAKILSPRRDTLAKKTRNQFPRNNSRDLLGSVLRPRRSNSDGMARYSTADQKTAYPQQTRRNRISGTWAWWNGHSHSQ